MGLFLVVRFFAGEVRSMTGQIAQQFEQQAERSWWSIAAEMASGSFSLEQEPYRVLILGTDEVDGSNRPTVLTDTILIASYQPQENTVRLLALPRDWYIHSQNMRINALYREDPSLPEREIEQLLGIDLHNTVVVRLRDLAELIDLLDGISVDVPHAFQDTQYPRDGVDVTVVRDPRILYETVRFEAGEQVFDGKRAVQYARTRKSVDPEEGGDQARIRRQEQVLNAVGEKLFSEDILANPEKTGQLYRWYSERFASQFPLPVFGKILTLFASHQTTPQIESLHLKVTDLPVAPDEDTLLIHPGLQRYGGQWVYDLADPTGQQLRDFVTQKNL